MLKAGPPKTGFSLPFTTVIKPPSGADFPWGVLVYSPRNGKLHEAEEIPLPVQFSELINLLGLSAGTWVAQATVSSKSPPQHDDKCPKLVTSFVSPSLVDFPPPLTLVPPRPQAAVQEDLQGCSRSEGVAGKSSEGLMTALVTGLIL